MPREGERIVTQKLLLIGGIRWPIIILFTSQFTVLIDYLCILDTTLKTMKT